MRLRFRYTKLGKIRFIGHRDLARVWERALRRSDLRVASTEGFSPRPKLHFGLALSTGFTSVAEYLDVDVLDDWAPDLSAEALDDLASRFSALLPVGIDVVAVGVPERGRSLQAAVTSCTWEVTLVGPDPAGVAERVAALMAADVHVIERVRDGATTSVDIRPSVLGLEVVGTSVADDGEPVVDLLLELGTVAPGLKLAELAPIIGPEALDLRACRLHQWIEGEGARHEPLPVANLPAHAGARVS